MYYIVLLLNFTAVTGHSQETHSGPRKQSSSSRQLLLADESPLPQRKQDASEVSQHQPQHSM